MIVRIFRCARRANAAISGSYFARKDSSCNLALAEEVFAEVFLATLFADFAFFTRSPSPSTQLLLLRPLIDPVVNRLVPELGILRLQYPMPLVRKVQHFRWNTLHLQR